METISVTLDRVLDDTESSRLAGTQDLDVSWTRVQFAPDGDQKRILVTDHTSWELTGGVGEFKTEPTPPGNALHVVVRGISEEIELWVTVAEGDSGKDLSELQTVDPDSLEPTPQAASAWELEATARAAADDDLATELAAKANATALTAEAAARAADVASLQAAIDELPTDSDVAAIAQSTVDAIVAGAPAALDTLVEIADRIADGDDTVAALIATVSEKANSADLGTAAAADTDDFATAAQGALADTATQPADVEAILDEYTPGTELGYAEIQSTTSATQLTTTQTANTTTASDIPGLSITFTGNGRPVLLTLSLGALYHSAADSRITAAIVVNGSLSAPTLQASVITPVAGSSGKDVGLTVRRRIPTTDGVTYTITARWAGDAGTKYLGFPGVSYFPSWLQALAC